MARFDNTRRQYLKSTIAAGAGVTALAGCLGGDDGDGGDGGGGGDGDSGDGGGPTELGLTFTVPIENLASLLDVPEIREEMDNIGETYTLDISQTSATPDTLNQMAAGETDIGLLSTVSYANAVQQEAVPGNITLISTDFWDAHPDHYGFTIYSTEDSGIVEPADMEGQTVATNGLGTGTHAIYVKQFRELGLEAGDNVEIVELDFPNMTSALEEGRIDAGMYPALLAGEPRQESFNEVFTSHDVFDSEYPFAYLVVANSSLEEKEDAIRDWGEDYRNLVDYIYDNRSEIVPLTAEHFELPEEMVDGFLLTEHDYYREDITTDTDRLQEVMDDLNDLGFLDESFDVDEYVTNEYVTP